MNSSDPILIVGAGMSGLTCATMLHQNGIPYRLFDKANEVGGRVRTDTVDGFRLDRGFQVLLTAYPEARRFLDYQALDLHSFRAGALIQKDGRFRRVSDPSRHPTELIATLRAGVGSIADKMRILKLRWDVRPSGQNQFGHQLTGESTLSALQREWGFSASMIDTFFRPFIGGITLDPTLSTDRAFFEFVMHMFSEGHAAFPTGGMQAIPNQLASKLNSEWIELNAGVDTIIDAKTLVLEDGSRVDGKRIVIATDMTGGHRLDSAIADRSWNATTCIYFDAPKAPNKTPVLMLNGDGTGQVNNVVVPSVVAPGYAPEGRHLVAVSLVPTSEIGEATPAEIAIKELHAWFGPQVGDWRHLKTYQISNALPSQTAGSRTIDPLCARLELDGRIICGHHLSTSSINGAMASGRVAAELILAANGEA